MKKKLVTLAAGLGLVIISNAQTLFVPTGTSGIGTSTTGNVGIGIGSPSSSFHIRTSTATLLLENAGIEGAYMTVHSGRFNRPAVTIYKQAGTEYWQTGILYDESGNQKYSIGTNGAFSSSKLTIQANGNVGIGTNAPSDIFQIGDFNTTNNYKLNIPGAYNFEQVRLGQYGNGNCGLELVNHNGMTTSYGIRLMANVDEVPGLQIQIASPTNAYNSLTYSTKLFINLDGNVGIGTTTPTGRIHSNVVGEYDITPLIRLGNDDNTGRWDVVNAGNPTGRRVLQAFNGTTKTIQFDPDGNIWFNTGGNVLIGKTTQEGTGVKYKLDVAGPIRANEIVVNTTGADFVFEPTYKLRSLTEVETFINQHKHLPDVAPATEMAANGISVSDLQTKLLQKVEELTLYSIEQDKAKNELKQRVEEQDKKLAEQAKQNAELKQEVEALKQLITQKLK